MSSEAINHSMTTRHFLKVLAGLPAAMLAIPAAKAKPSDTTWKGTQNCIGYWQVKTDHWPESYHHPMSDTTYWHSKGIYWTELDPNGITVIDPT